MYERFFTGDAHALEGFAYGRFVDAEQLCPFTQVGIGMFFNMAAQTLFVNFGWRFVAFEIGFNVPLPTEQAAYTDTKTLCRLFKGEFFLFFDFHDVFSKCYPVEHRQECC